MKVKKAQMSWYGGCKMNALIINCSPVRTGATAEITSKNFYMFSFEV